MEETEQEKEWDAKQNLVPGQGPTPIPQESTPYRRILLNNTVFFSNTLGQAGPIILFSHLKDIQICCGPYSTCTTGEDLRGHLCIDSGASKRGYRLLGTFLKGITVSPSYIGPDYASGAGLPPLNVTLLDAFGNMANEQAHLMITSSDSWVGLLGPMGAGMQINGTGIVTGITLRGEPGKHHLQLTATSEEEGRHTVVDDIVTVFVRKCRIGERAMDIECRKCYEHFYNFIPGSKTCKQCSENARCNGIALAPLDGYWHNSSHSDVIMECLNEKACKYENRTEELMRRAEESFMAGITWKENYPLCSKVGPSARYIVHVYLCLIENNSKATIDLHSSTSGEAAVMWNRMLLFVYSLLFKLVAIVL